MGNNNDPSVMAALAASNASPTPAAAAASSISAAAAAASSNTAAASSSASSSIPAMSLIRALDEVVLLDKRIQKKVSEATFMGVVSKKSRGGIQNPDEFNAAAKSDWQSITDLIGRRNRIKSAIILSNATTVVKVGGESLTVAEVIERKKSLSLQRELLQRLKSVRESSLRSLEQQNSAMESELQKLLEIHFGKGGSSKSQSSDIEDISRPFRENNQARLLDPLAADARIRELEAYIDEFEREAKFTLSEANAISKIYVQ